MAVTVLEIRQEELLAMQTLGWMKAFQAAHR
jgi:hypothetical protein